MRSGFVSLIGRPNVGKSTLLNAIIDEHIAITSDKAGTTRNIIEGIYNDDESQIVFVDTPGIHKPVSKLGKLLNKEAMTYTKEIDVILFMVDAKSGVGRGDEFIINSIGETDAAVFLVLNKIDMISKDDLLLEINKCKDLYPFREIIPVSAMTKDNISHLISVIKKYLVDDVRYFNTDDITTQKTSFIVSEYVREKVMQLTNDEVPHSVTCYTVSYNEKKNITEIAVDIIVDRDSLKKIIIGKQGSMLKEIGSKARKDIEALLDKKVYLELYVKTIPNWKDKERYLTELGFKEIE